MQKHVSIIVSYSWFLLFVG